MATRTVTGKIYDSDGVSPIRRLDLNFHYLVDDTVKPLDATYDAFSPLPPPAVRVFTDDNGEFSANLETGVRTAWTYSRLWNGAANVSEVYTPWNTSRMLILVPAGTGPIPIRECQSASMPTPPPNAKLVAMDGAYPPGLDHYPPPPSETDLYYYPFSTWRYPRSIVWKVA